ncbi:MAG TPA: hypothetical protein VL137_12150 [Polyangiaceae bacterium]|nr:hypothetical protein [Polyangiaceae bacterium]
MRLAIAVASFGLCGNARAAEYTQDGAFELWLQGTYSERLGERQSWTALLGVTIAFDRLNAPRIPLPGDAKSAAVAQEASDPGVAPVEKSEPARATDAPKSAWRLSNALIQAAVVEALRTAGVKVTDERLDSMRARARSSAALPELRLGAGRSTDQSLRLTPTVTDPYRYTQAGGAGLWLEARVSWRLDRLLFAREELAVERLARDQDQVRWKCVRAVIDALFAWQKALIEEADPLLSPEQQQLAQLRALRAAAEVDALTGGWFWGKMAAVSQQAEQGE